MSTTSTSLIPGSYYHIYNRGINREKLFIHDKDYLLLLKLLTKHAIQDLDFFAYCLLKNHFHFLIRVKEENSRKSHLGLSHAFNSYTQIFNKENNRTGTLFERPFRRKLINTDQYLTQVIAYIHTNPVHHQIINDFSGYPYSSFHIILSNASTQLKRDEVIDLFDNREEFIKFHKHWQDEQAIREWILEN
ncbi:transposase [candidate division KSB1 bacterium]|nr:transposase [candidate division KSB1 bacterium]